MKHKRGAIKKASSSFLGLWLPLGVADAIDQQVVREDSDRSKFVRKAIKEKLEREKLTA
jgi:metal-responsive CopG/Arc/MetJ family transcriptional regulator